jgi:seryl-tRNA synthetase
MLDIKLIRENAELVKKKIKDKGVSLSIDELIEVDTQRRKLLNEVEQMKHERNVVSDKIGKLLKEKKDTKDLISSMKDISQNIKDIDTIVGELSQKITQLMLTIPNMAHDCVPVGSAEKNKMVKEWGERRDFEFEPRPHTDIAETLGIIDMPRASKITGSNFVLYKGLGARMERALISFMLDLHTRKHGYTEVFPPFLVNKASMIGTGQLPKLEEDMYRLKDDELYLIPTAEVPVTNMHRDEILDEGDLPVYYTAYTACFRREAGSYGKDTKGLVRVHQFDKVELVKFVKPESSFDELENLLNDAEEVLQAFKIPYRVMLLATGDMSFAASKCYDIEIWSPGLKRYLEVSSCSNFTDFQARRANIRYRPSGKKGTEFVHTLNGSGVALARLVAAILETYQQKEGSVEVPVPLRPFMDGIEKITLPE